jgi:hypothetical protein
VEEIVTISSVDCPIGVAMTANIQSFVAMNGTVIGDAKSPQSPG